MRWRSRWLLLGSLTVAYVGWASLRASAEPRWRFVVLLVMLLAFVRGWAAAQAPSTGEDAIAGAARSALRTCLFGATLVAASLLGPIDRDAILAATMLGAAIAVVSAIVALARIPPAGGLAEPPAYARRLGPAFAGAAVGLVAAFGPALRALGIGRRVLDPGWLHAVAASACVTELILLLAVAYWLAGMRRLEIGVADRLRAACYFALAAGIAGVPAALLAPAGAETRASALFVTAGALLVAITVVVRDPARAARAQRSALALAIVGAPIALFAGAIAQLVPQSASAIAVVAVVLGAAAGVVSVPLGSRENPAAMRWLAAIEKATAQAQRLDADAALVSALASLRETNRSATASPVLYRFDPPEVLSADRAGYPHRTTDSSLPSGIVSLVRHEPLRVLQSAVLDAIEVRRPEVRAAAAWLRERDAFAATVLDDGEGAMGLLVIPAAGRGVPLALVEARALLGFADRFASVLSSSSALARSRVRELDAKTRADRAERQAEELSTTLVGQADRFALDAKRLARPAAAICYSAAARMADDALRRLGESGAHTALLVPPGTDPVPYAAVVHLSGPRRQGPLVVIDAADGADGRPGDPLALARGGTLVVLNASAMPADLQAALTVALAETTPFGVVLALFATVDALVATGQLTEALADRLGDRAVAIPPLADRADDLRAIMLDRLARIGVRLRGRPFGLEPLALARLIEHGWPGNDVEVEDVLTRAALGAAGDLVKMADLDRIRFAVVPAAPRRTSRPPAPAAAKA